MTPWRRRLRRLRLAATFTCATLIIVAAVVVALVQLLLPQIASHPERVASFLAERIGRPVSIDKVHGEWAGAGPVLRLEGVHIAASDVASPPLVIPEAEIALDFTAWARSNRRFSEFRLIGLDLALTRGDDGRWNVSGLTGGDAAASEGENPLLMLGALVVRDTRVRIVDTAQSIDVAVRADEVRLLNWDGRHRLLGFVRRDGSTTPPLAVIIDYDAATQSGRAYLGARDTDFAALADGFTVDGLKLGSGNGRVQIWADVRDGAVDSAQASFDVAGLDVVSASATRDAPQPLATGLARLAGIANWRRETNGWRFDVAKLRAARDTRDPPETQASVIRGVDAEGAPEYRFTSQQLDLSTLSALAALPGLAPSALREWLVEAKPRGQIVDVAARCGGACDGTNYDVSAQLSGIALTSAGSKPGIDRLDATLAGDAGAIVLHLPQQATVVRYPHKFREPFELSRFGGDVAAFRTDDGWRVETDGLDVEGTGYSLQARGGIELPDDGTKPLLDLYALVAWADVRVARNFLPIGDLGPNTTKWLQQGLIDGTIDSARAVVRGDLDDWPFVNLAGRFDAHVEVSGLTLDYSPGKWPRADGVSVVAEFVNNGLRAEASGNVMGAHASSAVAVIPDFKDAVLALDVEGEGPGPELLNVLHASPLGERYKDELAGIAIGGKGALKFRLDLPLKPEVPGKIRGEVDLTDARLEAKKWNIDFAGANGKLRFDDGGFVAGPFAIRYRDLPARFTVAVGNSVTDRNNAVEARLEGNLPMSVVFADFEALRPWWPKFPGSSDWTVSVAIPRPGAAEKATTVRMRSELRGIAIQLPAPLDKLEGDALPIDIALNLPVEGSPITIALGDVARLRGRLPSPSKPSFAATLGLGDQMPDAVPNEGVAITGRAALIDLSGWTGVGFGAGPDLIQSVDIVADRARLGGSEFRDVGFRIEDKPDAIHFVLSGPTVAGTVQVPSSDIVKRGITLQLDRLHWPDSPKPAPGTPDTDPLDGVVPSTIPPLHIAIGDFRLGTAVFGATRLESVPSGDGMRIDQFETRSDALQMHARGEWSGDGRTHRTTIDMDLTSENIGRMLSSLGFGGLFDGGQTLAHIDAHWNGSPATFSPARLEGKLKLNVNEGRVLDVEPGVGRIFGLFSVREIPRRLALDFGDFFRTGMSFTSITGEFELRDGSAFTQNLHIASPAADIRIDGRTGLKAKDYDQQMVVTPRVGGTFTVVGALAGGPAGAAAGLAVQTLFNKAINQVTSARYHVGGSWEKPDIKLISKERARKKKADDK